MELFDLQAVLAVYQCRNYNDAAYQLAISSSTLSKTIKRVEDELGVTLFVRATKSRAVELTEAGAKLIPSIKANVFALLELQRQAKQLAGSESTEINIGYVPSIDTFGDSKLLSDYILGNPSVHVHMRPGSPDKLLDLLSSGTLDCLLIVLSQWDLEPGSSIAARLYAPGLVAQELRTISGVSLAVNPESPLAKLSELTPKDFPMLHGKTVLLNSRSSYCQNVDRFRKELMLPDSIKFKMHIVDFDRPGTIYTALFEKPDVIIPCISTPNKRKREYVRIPFATLNVKTHLYFVYARANKSTALRAFRKSAMDFQDTLDGPGIKQKYI